MTAGFRHRLAATTGRTITSRVAHSLQPSETTTGLHPYAAMTLNQRSTQAAGLQILIRNVVHRFSSVTIFRWQPNVTLVTMPDAIIKSAT
jgi:hypothetical protein